MTALRWGLLMSFKLLLGAVSLLTMIGCGDFLRGHSHDPAPLNVESQETLCLKEVPNRVAQYFNDQLSAAQLKESFTCLQKSLKTFARYTKGASPDLYTHREVQQFLNQYLMNESQISDDHMDELMKLKVLFVGGSHRSFTRIEIDQLGSYREL